MDASPQAANTAMESPAPPKRRRFREKTPSPQSAASSSTDSFSGSPAESENDPLGDSRSALGPLPERLNFDACEYPELHSDSLNQDAEVKGGLPGEVAHGTPLPWEASHARPPPEGLPCEASPGGLSFGASPGRLPLGGLPWEASARRVLLGDFFWETSHGRPRRGAPSMGGLP